VLVLILPRLISGKFLSPTVVSSPERLILRL
jgi:hypothetical protein